AQERAIDHLERLFGRAFPLREERELIERAPARLALLIELARELHRRHGPAREEERFEIEVRQSDFIGMGALDLAQARQSLVRQLFHPDERLQLSGHPARVVR